MRFLRLALIVVALVAFGFGALQWWGTGWEDTGPDGWVRIETPESGAYSIVSPGLARPAVGVVSDDKALADPASWEPIHGSALIGLDSGARWERPGEFCASRRRLLVGSAAPPATTADIIAVFDHDVCQRDATQVWTLTTDGRIDITVENHQPTNWTKAGLLTAAACLAVAALLGLVQRFGLSRDRNT